MTTYKVIKPQIVVRDAQEEPQQHMLLQDAVFSGDGLDQDHVKMLLDEGFIEKVKAPKASDSSDDADDGKPTSVKDIVAAVGTDKALAQQYLDEENAKGDDARSSLVEKLQAVVDAE